MAKKRSLPSIDEALGTNSSRADFDTWTETIASMLPSVASSAKERLNSLLAGDGEQTVRSWDLLLVEVASSSDSGPVLFTGLSQSAFCLDLFPDADMLYGDIGITGP